jgi:sterol desaturase/sphingolipid hydroxylase (fatty acid hydroxylase superfamily)
MFCSFCNDLLFYVFHRFFHHNSLYQYIHKQHHEYKGSIGFAAEYAHFIEALTANLIPTFFGGIVLGVHLVVWSAWLTCRLLETYETHSGYDFGYLSFYGMVREQ